MARDCHCIGTLRRTDPEHRYPHQWVCLACGHVWYGREDACLQSTPWPEITDGEYAVAFAEGYVRAAFLATQPDRRT